MKATTAEKEWLRRMSGKLPVAGDDVTPVASEAEHPDSHTVEVAGNGLKDVAGMEELKRMVTESFINVLRNKECAKVYGIQPPSILFYGPSGCGKTFFAEKMAEEIGINFIKVVPDDIASKWIHGTQQKIDELFRKAESKAPTIMFFDEFDAMVPCRSANDINQHQNGEVNEFLCKLNNASQRGVYVIAATNHPERIDRAILRTGRIDEMIYIGMPDLSSRESLFRLSLSNLPVDDVIDYSKLALLTEGYNCSDISYIVKVASRKMFNETISENSEVYKKITQKVLEDAIAHKSPSVTRRDIREYERVRGEFSTKDAEVHRVAIGFK